MFIPRSVSQLFDVLYVRAVAGGDLSVYILHLFLIFPPFKSYEEIQHTNFSFVFILDPFSSNLTVTENLYRNCSSDFALLPQDRICSTDSRITKTE